MRSVIGILCFSILLSGCAVGPRFEGAQPVPASAYTSTPLVAETASASGKAGEAQRFVETEKIPQEWWALFHCEALDQVIRMGLERSPSLQAAEAALVQAQETLNARVGTQRYPAIDAGLSSSRQKVSPSSSGVSDGKGSIFDLHHASVGVSYVFDIFGGARREVEALEAQVDYQRFRLEAAHLTLAANIVTTAFKEASVRAQIRAMEEIIALQEKQLTLLEQQFTLGGISRAEVLAQRAQLEQTRAARPAFDKELSAARHQLSVLVGRLPSEEKDLPVFDLETLALPQDLPVSLPSELAHKRPDIRAAEALLHAASAQVGVATANMYPQITLNGSYGFQENHLQDIFDIEHTVWNLGAGVVQPVFHGGALRAKRRAAVAAFDQASAEYRQTVLVAFQNVADVLRALEADARTLKAQADAELTSGESLKLAEEQFKAGAVSYSVLLNAQRQYQQAKISLIQARAQRFADTAALFQALGGGWRDDIQLSPTVKDTNS